MFLSGILWNIPSVTCNFRFTHESLGNCVYMYQENTSDKWDRPQYTTRYTVYHVIQLNCTDRWEGLLEY